ncbi:MAG: hypothetical protein IJH20_06465 [Bacilli bacterium]|nr:hypothetical protein [Bacilli bacterium]
MKECHLWLLDGTEIVLKGERYEDLLCEIDNFFDIFKENVTYYLGYDDKSIIEQAKEEEINIEEV